MSRRITLGASVLALSSLLASCAPPSGEASDDDASSAEAPLGTAKYGVDISVWSGEITDAEVRCWWSEGVRHVIVGTQDPRIARQQLDRVESLGMTVDLYVYLYWTRSMTAQVNDALALAADHPHVGRLWLDVEEAPGGNGKAALTTKLNEALAACGSMECGIYTANWWWQPAMAGSTAFKNVPLWYAFYDSDPSFSTWSTQKFGGWLTPTAKQWQDQHLCGIDVDKDTMFVSATPPAPPAPLPAPQPGLPPAPVGLYPDQRLPIVGVETVRLLTDTVPGASQYAFEIQSWNGSAYVPYFTFAAAQNAQRFSPSFHDRVYRWRARAKNADGWGAWSAWATYEFGKAKSYPPVVQPPDPQAPPQQPPPQQPPPQPVAGAPTGLTPADGSHVASGAVALGCAPVSGATSYEFEIQSKSGQVFVPYYTYAGASPTRTFFPQTSGVDYRFRVRAKTGSGWSPESSWSGFHFGP